jgi:hypothetical protein
MAEKFGCLQRNGPNRLAFSPDEKSFNDNWANKKKVTIRYDVNVDGTLSNAKVFFDMTNTRKRRQQDPRSLRQTGLYNIRLNVPGIRPPLAQKELAKR